MAEDQADGFEGEVREALELFAVLPDGELFALARWVVRGEEYHSRVEAVAAIFRRRYPRRVLADRFPTGGLRPYLIESPGLDGLDGPFRLPTELRSAATKS